MSINFSVLKNPNDHSFKIMITEAPKMLEVSQAQEFFTIIMEHFKKEIAFELKRLILDTVIQLLTIDGIRAVFCNEFIKKLPFNQGFDTEILDILNIIVTHSPESIENDISHNFSRLTAHNPSKCLIILAIYSQSFDQIDIAWNFFDTLFRNCKYFEIPELVPHYFTLIVNLIQNHSDFCDARIEIAWKTVCKAFSLSDHIAIAHAFYSLSKFAELAPDRCQNFDFPLDAVIKYISVPDTQRAVFSLLFRLRPNPSLDENSDYEGIPNLITKLFDIAQKNSNASLILMKMAFDIDYADMILDSNEGRWLTLALPSYMETCRLFTIILTHSQLRIKVVQNNFTITFFSNLINFADNKLPMCNALCTFLRRMPLNESFLKGLSRCGFFQICFNAAIENKPLFLLLIDTVAKVAYVKDFIDVLDKIIEFMRTARDIKLLNSCLCVCLDLSKYKNCALKFQEKKLNDIMKRFQDEKLQKLIKKINQSIDNTLSEM